MSCILIINPSAGLCPPVTLPVATFHLVPDSSNKISHVHPKRRQAISDHHHHRFLHRLRGILIPRLAASSHHHQFHPHPQRSITRPMATDDVDHETLPLLHNHGLHQQQIAHLSCQRGLPFGLRQHRPIQPPTFINRLLLAFRMTVLLNPCLIELSASI